MSKYTKISSIIVATVLSLAACSTPAEETETVPPTTNVAENVEETIIEEPEIEITYEVNTPEVIETILNLWRDSSDRQKQSGFLESRQLTIKNPDGEENHTILVINSPADPENIYYYDTSRGFSQVTKLLKREIDYPEIIQFIAEITNMTVSQSESEEELLNNITFKKENPTNVFIMEENRVFGEPTEYRIEQVNGLISKVTTTNQFLTETITLQYGISELAQQYINEAFDPKAPFVDPFAEFNTDEEE